MMAWVGIAMDDGRKSIRNAGSYGDIGGYLEGLSLTWDDVVQGRGPGGRAIRSGRTQVNQDYVANPDIRPWLKRALAQGFQSSIGLPLMDGQTAFGLLSAYASEPHAFDSAETRLLEELAHEMAAQLLVLRESARA